jgi:hypothetical protein
MCPSRIGRSGTASLVLSKETIVFKLTDAAAAFLADKLESLHSPSRVVRLSRNTDGLHLRLSDSRPGDQSFSYGDRTVFVVDDNLSQRLTTRTMDVRNTPDGVKLSLKGPQAE